MKTSRVFETREVSWAYSSGGMRDNAQRMKTVTLSPKHQIVIPLAIRQSLGIRPGQKMLVLQVEGRIELIPVAKAKKLRGFLRGIDTTVQREEDRR